VGKDALHWHGLLGRNLGERRPLWGSGLWFGEKGSCGRKYWVSSSGSLLQALYAAPFSPDTARNRKTE
jgi:hypothetical protein